MALFTNITKKWARGEAQAMKQATTDSLALLRALTEFHERTRSLAFCPLCFVSYGEPHTFKCPLGTKVSPTDLVSWECPLPDDIAGVLHECPSTFDHAAFSCCGRAEFERKLEQSGIAFTTARVPGTTQVQLFIKDPAGNGVELNFAAEDA